jgi:hypothetical protein
VITRVLPCLPALALLLAAAPAGADETINGSFVLDGLDRAAATATESADPCALPTADVQPNAPAPGEAPAAPASLLASAEAATLAAEPLAAAQAAPAPRAMAFEYSDGYMTRLKIHKYASYATLPIFVAQTIIGQKLYNGDTSDSMRSAHNALVAGTAVLFGVNTVTGVWNLGEGMKDPNHKTKRMVHGFLMLAADAGFVATGLMAPHTHHNENGFETVGGSSPSTHRAVALTSMGLATVSYLMMLFH